MKRPMHWITIPTAIAIIGAIAAPSLADVSTPINSAITRSGNVTVSGSAGSCGIVPNQPVEVIHVTEPFASLRFTLDSESSATLWITGNGQSQCLFSDNFSNGVIDLPGVWDRGTYSVYVGNRANGSYVYELTIAP
jgi:hypothetical protein